MAFDVNQFIQQKKSGAGGVPKPTGGFDVNKFLQDKGANLEPRNRILAPSSILKTQSGLEATAKRAGLQDETTRILSQKGEDPEKIYSGGFISDVFDTLNALQYGVTGVIQGKSFGEGIASRASFTKQENLKEMGLTGMIAGIALDIAVDPMTYITPWKALSKVPGLFKLVTETTEAIGKTKPGAWVGSRFVYRFGQDPLYKAMDERRIRNIGVGTENMMNLVRPIAKLDSLAQKSIADARKAGTLNKLPDELRELALPAFNALDDLGKKSVEAGLLSKKTWEENLGTYIGRFYKTKEKPDGAVAALKGLFPTKPLRINLDRFKARKDIPEEVRQAMGEIMEAGYPTAKSLVQLTNAVENANFFKGVAQRFGKDVVEEGLEKLPVSPRLGALSGKAVPKVLADSVNEIIRPAEKTLSKVVVGGFKFGKVILNPATHARNMASNVILNSWEGMNPADPRALKAYAIASKEIAKGGKWWDEAKQAGLGLDTYAANEIRGFLDGPEVKSLGETVKNSMNKLADLYEKEEQWAKLSQYIFQRQTKGLSAEDAWKIAERATFNYAQVTPFIRRLRESLFGFPFVTFTYKVTPQAVKTLVKNPTRISNIGKFKQAIENQSNPEELQRERASEPDWVRDGFYVKLPIKDKEGRSAYLDLTYILPFGDLVSGQYLERGINRDTGLPEPVARAGLRKSPFLNFVAELAENKDFFGNRIVQASDPIEAQMGDVFRHITKTYLPPLVADQIPGGYRADGTHRPSSIQKTIEREFGGIDEGGLMTRNLMEEMLKNVGLKISPVDVVSQESFSEREKIKAIQTLLQDKGIISKFSIPFTPKTD